MMELQREEHLYLVVLVTYMLVPFALNVFLDVC
jgi:hypothetical protein